MAALCLSSLAMYSYSLEGQPWHGDEITYLGWGANYVNLISKGDFGSPCLVTLDRCHQLFHIPAFGLTYSPLRNILIGTPMYLLGQDAGNFYNWSCFWDCYHKDEGPTISEMTAGRILSPAFGAGAIVLAFVIGKKMFDRNFGILAAALLMFYDLWVWYSREIMVEIHYVFFSLLSIALLLHSFESGRIKLRYFVPSGIMLGIALNSKLLAVCFSGLFFCLILFKTLSSQNVGEKKNRVGRATVFVSVFFLLSLLGMALAEPGFYQNPVGEIKQIKYDMDNYNRDVWYIGYPTTHNLQAGTFYSLMQFTVFPSFLEKQISAPSNDIWGNFGWTYPPTYSSIPLAIFFFAGVAFLVYNTARSKNMMTMEVLLLTWFATTVVFTMLIVKDFSLERYLMPVEISMIFISCYGLWSFARAIRGMRTRLAFASVFISSHAATSLLYLDKIYFSPGTMWVNPLHYGTLQESLDNPFTLAVNIVFVAFLVIVLAVTLNTRRSHTFGDINSGAGQDLKR